MSPVCGVVPQQDGPLREWSHQNFISSVKSGVEFISGIGIVFKQLIDEKKILKFFA